MTPHEQALGHLRSMVSIRGKWQAALDAAVMPTFHPAYLFRVSSARAAFEEDFRAVAELLGLKVPT